MEVGVGMGWWWWGRDGSGWGGGGVGNHFEHFLELPATCRVHCPLKINVVLLTSGGQGSGKSLDFISVG